MKRITSLLVCLLLFGFSAMFGQNIQIKGTVTSADDGSTLPGVYVKIKGTNTGTATDVDGKYQVTAEDGATLVFTSIGFQELEVLVAGQSILDVALEQDVTHMDEVVVTALGIQRSQKSLGYSVSNVSADKANVKAEPDMLKALQGKVPGVNINVSQGAPGSATRINIRGNSSFYGDNQALIIVDGIPYSNDQVTTSNQASGNGGAYSNGLSTLDPNNIESVNVLKGSAAAALYGSRASNGVLVVTTKSGSGGKSRKGMEVTLTSSYSWEKIANLPEYQNTYGAGSDFTYSNANGSWGAKFGTIDSVQAWPAYYNVFPELFSPTGRMAYKAQPDNVESLFRTGSIFENSVNIAGGDGINSFSATASSMIQDGYIPNSSFDRYSISVGGNSKLNNGINVGGNLSYSKTDQLGSFFGENQFDGAASSFARALFLARNWDMTLPYENPANGHPISSNPSQYDHPLWSFQHNTISTVTDRIVAGLNLDYTIAPWLNAAYKIGYNNLTMNRMEVTDIGSRAAAGTGEIVEDNYNKREIESNFMLTFTKMIGQDFSLKAILGHNVNARKTLRQAYNGSIIVSPGIYDIDNTQKVEAIGGGRSERRLWALFGDITLGYKSWLFLNVTGRNDFSSTLPEDSRSYFYPAFSGAFIFSDAFGMNNNILNYGKIRAGFAQVGNDADPYSLQNVYVVGSTFLDKPTMYTPNGARNPNLTPEMSKEIELGSELHFVDSRITFDFTWYNKESEDMIASVPIPAASGFTSSVMNFGSMRNRGVEIGVNLIPVKLQNGLQWSIFTAFTKNKNEVLELTSGVEWIPVQDLGIDVTPTITPGYAHGAFRGSYALRDDAGRLIINPITGFPFLALDEKIIGDPNPDYNLGITNTISFKGITLSALWDLKKGGDVYSVTLSSLLGRGVTKDTEDREHFVIIPGVYGNNEGLVYTDASGNAITNKTHVTTNDLYFYPGGNETTFAINGAAEYQIYDGTVYRLREVSLGYDLPKKIVEKVKLGGVNISLVGRNLWYFAPNVPEYSNFDPDINGFGSTTTQGLDLSCAPTSRRISVNLMVKF
ncbi:MAG: SusC/RagA family TonB-linked outer membrane protein [Bacteroidales bacterium]